MQAEKRAFHIGSQEKYTCLLPGLRSGTVTVPSSKSQLIRLLILAAFGENETKILCRGLCGDVDACISCLEALGAEIRRETDGLRVLPVSHKNGQRSGRSNRQENTALFCGESASVLRFLLPMTGALGRPAVFHLEGRLPNRPLEPYAELLRAHGMRIRQENTLLFAEGRLLPGRFRIPGNISSQYISGLLMALPLLSGDSTLEVTGPVGSAGYIGMTEEALELGGIRFFQAEHERPVSGNTEEQGSETAFFQPEQKESAREDAEEPESGTAPLGEELTSVRKIPGFQSCRFPPVLQAEGDYSAAAFFLCMGAFSERGILVRGLSRTTRQGDSRILELLREMGAEIRLSEEGISVRGSGLRGCRIDASGIPDLVPALAVAAAAAAGRTEICHASRLRFKESDRLRSTAELITALGGSVLETEDGLAVTGLGKLAGGTADPHGDHRIAMAAAVAACVSEAPVLVKNKACAAKSFPAFWEEFEALLLSEKQSC